MKAIRIKVSLIVPIRWQAGSKSSVLLKQLLPYSTAAQKAGWNFGTDPVDTAGRTWLSKVRPLELTLEQSSGHRVYLRLHKAVVATSVKWWEDAGAVRLGTDTNMVMLGSLIHPSRCSPVSKSTPLPPPDSRSRFDLCAWSKQQIWFIVLTYAEVMKHRTALWVPRPHQPLNSHNQLDPPFCHLCPFISPPQSPTKLTPTSNYLFLIGHSFAVSKIWYFWYQRHLM